MERRPQRDVGLSPFRTRGPPSAASRQGSPGDSLAGKGSGRHPAPRRRDGRADTFEGFPPLSGIATGDDGSVYASSLFAGTVFRIAPDGSTSVAQVAGPTGMGLEDGALYVGSLDFGGGPGSVLALSPSAFGPLEP